MKIRTDFVTNSSSSSFIIGKKDDNITVDIVYNLIREYYQELVNKRDALISDCNKFRMFWDVENKCFKFLKGKSWDSKNKEIDNLVKKQYGINSWDYFTYDFEWLNCKSYSEYMSYWVQKIKNNETKNIYAPFTLIDYASSEDIIELHCGNYGLQKKLNVLDNEELSWYIGCSCNIFTYQEKSIFEQKGDCNYCEYTECDSIFNKIKNGEITKKNIMLEFLGRICIRSECGYIPDYVVNKLYEISTFACNHMG